MATDTPNPPTDNPEARETMGAEESEQVADNGRKIPTGDPHATTIAVRRQAHDDAEVIVKALPREEQQALNLERQFVLLAWGNIEAQFQLRLRQGQRLLKMRKRIRHGFVSLWRRELAIEIKKLGARYGEDRMREDLGLALAVERDPTLSKTIVAAAMESARIDFRRLQREVQAHAIEDEDDDDGEDEPGPADPTPTPPAPGPNVGPAAPRPEPEPDPEPPPPPDPAVLEADLARVRSELASEKADAEELEDMMHTIGPLTLAPGQITYAGQNLSWDSPKPVGEVLDWMAKAYEAAEPEPDAPSVWDRIRRPIV